MRCECSFGRIVQDRAIRKWTERNGRASLEGSCRHGDLKMTSRSWWTSEHWRTLAADCGVARKHPFLLKLPRFLEAMATNDWSSSAAPVPHLKTVAGRPHVPS